MKMKILSGAFLLGLFLLTTTVCCAYEEDIGLYTKEYLQTAKQSRDKYNDAQSKIGAAFQEQLTKIPPEKRWQKLEKYIEQQEQSYTAFRQQMQKDHMSFIKESIFNNDKLNTLQKNELISFFAKQDNATESFFAKARNDRIACFEKINRDPSMSYTQKEQALHDFSYKQRNAAKEQYLAQKIAKDNELKKIRMALERK